MDTQSKPSLDSFVGQPQQVSKPSLASFVKPYDGSQDITNSAAGLGMTNTLNSQDLNTLQTQHPDMNTQQFNDIQTQNPGASVAGVSDLATQQQTNDSINKGLSNVGGFIKGAINDAQKLGASALAMPIDIVRQLFGKTPLSGTYPSIVGNDPTKTFQADTQDYKTNVVDQGGGSMGQDLQQVINPVMAGASLLGGFGENAAGDSLVKQGIDKGLDTASAGADAASNVVNTAKTTLANRAEESSMNRAIETVSPRLTPKVAESATTKTSDILGKTSIVPETRTLDMANAVKDVIKGKSFSEDKELVKTAISNEAENLKTQISSVDHAVPKKELKVALRSSERPVLVASDTTMNNAYTKVLNKANEIIDTMKGTVSGTLDGRKTFDQFIEKQFPNLYNSDAMTPMRTAIKDIRSKWNEFTSSQLPDDVGFQDSLKKQNLMYDALDNISEKAARGAPKVQGEIGTNRLTRFAEKHPVVTKGIKAAGVGAAGAVGAGGVYEGAKLIGE